MTIISGKDLDRQMGMQIDPNSVPKHNGGDPGAMAGIIRPGSEHQRKASQELRRGSLVFDASEVGETGFYGSQTVISVSDAPPLEEKLDPASAVAAVPVPGAEGGAPAPVPVRAPPAARSPAAILARIGYKRPLGT